LWKSLKGLPRNIWLICVVSLINRTGTMVFPFLALYLTQEIGVEPGKAGLVITFYGIGALLSAPFAGKLSDKIGALNLIKFSLLLTGVLFFVYSLFDNYIAISITSVILAIISESFRPAAMAFISNEVSVEQRKPAYALYRLAINLGMSIGPVLGGILSSINFHFLFYVDGITSIAAGIFLIFAKWELKSVNVDSENSENDKNPLISKSVWSDGKFIYFLFALLPVVLVFFQHFSSMPIFVVDELGFSRATFGLLFVVNTVLIIILEVPLNAMMSHWPNWKGLAIGSLLCAIGFGGMVFTTEIIGLIITIIIWTFGEMIFFPASASFAADISPEKRRGEYMGYYQMMFSLAFTLAPWGGAKIYEVYGSQTLWSVAFVSGLISVIMIFVIKNYSETKKTA
ncbi:MAG: MFS transporter, partial [Ignavibacteriae bacterium]|nr:MFS transporter [Ignavibacteriota bacterium]